MAKKFEYLVIHCTATREGENITPEQIREWHMGENGRGWSRVGYSDLIMLDGSLVNLHFAKGSNPYDGIIDYHEMTWGCAWNQCHFKTRLLCRRRRKCKNKRRLQTKKHNDRKTKKHVTNLY